MLRTRSTHFLAAQIAGAALCLGLASPFAAGEASSDLSSAETTLNAAFKGKILVLRNFYTGSRLEFGNDGMLQRGGKPGYWTTDAKVEIKGIKVRRNDLEIEGRRIWFQYDQKAERFQAFGGPSVKIKIRFDPSTASLDHLQSSIVRVFHGEDQKLTDSVPTYWQWFLATDAKRDSIPLVPAPDGNTITSNPKGGVTAPVPTFKPDPPYTPAARDAKLKGKVVVFIVVDTEGNVSDVRIVQPIGLGLDDQAVSTIRTWKFKPGMRNGNPVAVKVLIEVEFRI